MAASTTPRQMPRLLKATYLADQETLLDETRATGLFYFPGVIVWLLIFGLLSYFSAAALYGWAGIAVFTNALKALPDSFPTYIFYLILLLFLIGWIWLVVRYLRWISTVYAVTNRRVIVQKGILGRTFDEIPILQVRGVDVHQSFGQRILGYGTIRVSSEGGRSVGNEDWLGIPKPFRFQKIIENATISLQSPSSGGYSAPNVRR
jgi:membrane protein YdbS with pleckstrin-like domain